MALDVIVKISKNAAAGFVGLGFPLIVQGIATKAVAYTECNDLAAVAAAGFAEDTEVYKNCAAIFAQENRPKKVAVCAGTGKITATLDTIKDKDFRQVIPVFGDADDKAAELAAYIEATDNRVLFLAVAATSELAGVAKFDRTFAIVYKGADKAAGAIVGATAGLAAGSFTYKNIVLKGVTPDELTDVEIEDIHDAGAVAIVKKAGDVVTTEGKVTSGEYLDIIDSKDYIINNIAYQTQKLLNGSPKLTFDNVGISQIEAVVTNVLVEAYGMGIIATDDEGNAMYSTAFATRAETPESDRATRTYKGGSFTFTLAGAIHYAEINGTLEI